MLVNSYRPGRPFIRFDFIYSNLESEAVSGRLDASKVASEVIRTIRIRTGGLQSRTIPPIDVEDGVISTKSIICAPNALSTNTFTHTPTGGVNPPPCHK